MVAFICSRSRVGPAGSLPAGFGGHLRGNRLDDSYSLMAADEGANGSRRRKRQRATSSPS